MAHPSASVAQCAQRNGLVEPPIPRYLRCMAESDARLLLKKDGTYHDAHVQFDLDRGKFWIYLEDGDVLCIEAPRLRLIVARYDEQLAASGLAPTTEDGYGR
jgi:hypothetical protein